MTPADLRWGEGLDAAEAAGVLARFGRAHLPGVLPEAAARTLHAGLAAPSAPWRRNLCAGATHVSVPLAEFEASAAGWRRQVDAAVGATAADGFSYRFDSYPVAEELEAGRRTGFAAEAVYDALNAPAGLAWLRAVTGDPRCAYVDAQATRFRPGDFLTGHDDDVAGKDRLFAYVLNLNPRWRPEWGGLLLFTDGDGHVAEGYTPAWNALNLLRVPQAHLVSAVAAFAPAPRLSVTGWIRSKRPR